MLSCECVGAGKFQETWVDAHSCGDSVAGEGARGEAITGPTESPLRQGNKIQLLNVAEFCKIAKLSKRERERERSVR